MATEVKICGLTRREDASAALDAGADYLGFVVYPESPRGITPLRMVRILGGLATPCRAVGVFVNAPRGEVEKIAADASLHAVQIHGDEPPGAFADMPLPVWRAVKLGGEHGPLPRPGDWPAERYVVDAAVRGLYGGTGQTADWDRAAAFAAAYPAMLAGGLTPDNVAEAIRAVKPLGVDVASGVEAEPGRKDHVKLRAFLKAARGAFLQNPAAPAA